MASPHKELISVDGFLVLGVIQVNLKRGPTKWIYKHTFKESASTGIQPISPCQLQEPQSSVTDETGINDTEGVPGFQQNLIHITNIPSDSPQKGKSSYRKRQNSYKENGEFEVFSDAKKAKLKTSISEIFCEEETLNTGELYGPIRNIPMSPSNSDIASNEKVSGRSSSTTHPTINAKEYEQQISETEDIVSHINDQESYQSVTPTIVSDEDYWINEYTSVKMLEGKPLNIKDEFSDPRLCDDMVKKNYQEEYTRNTSCKFDSSCKGLEEETLADSGLDDIQRGSVKQCDINTHNRRNLDSNSDHIESMELCTSSIPTKNTKEPLVDKCLHKSKDDSRVVIKELDGDQHDQTMLEFTYHIKYDTDSPASPISSNTQLQEETESDLSDKREVILTSDNQGIYSVREESSGLNSRNGNSTCLSDHVSDQSDASSIEDGEIVSDDDLEKPKKSASFHGNKAKRKSTLHSRNSMDNRARCCQKTGKRLCPLCKNSQHGKPNVLILADSTATGINFSEMSSHTNIKLKKVYKISQAMRVLKRASKDFDIIILSVGLHDAQHYGLHKTKVKLYESMLQLREILHTHVVVLMGQLLRVERVPFSEIVELNLYLESLSKDNHFGFVSNNNVGKLCRTYRERDGSLMKPAKRILAKNFSRTITACCKILQEF